MKFPVKLVGLAQLLMLLMPQSLSASCPAGAKPFATPAADAQVQSDLFTVTYYSTYKVVKYSGTLGQYKSGWPNVNERGAQIPDLVLYQCGTDKPTTSQTGVTDGAHFFEIPIQRAALPWTGAMHFFEMLSLTGAISQIDMSYITSPCAQLLEVCTPGIHASAYSNSWTTHVASADAIFTDSWGVGFSNSARDVVFDVAFEPGALQRAGWLRFLALFFNEEDIADGILNRIEADYAALKAEATRLHAEDAGGLGGRRPAFAWVTSFAHTCPETYVCPSGLCTTCEAAGWKNLDGNWCQCGGWTLSNAHFKRELVEDAGGRLVSLPAIYHESCSIETGNDGSTLYSCMTPAASHFKALVMEADVIVDETSVNNHGAYTLDDFARNFDISSSESSTMRREAVFRIDGSVSDEHASGTVGSSWNEQMHAQPQQALSDVMMGAWGSAFSSRCSLKFFRKLHGGQAQDVLQHTDCPIYSGTPEQFHCQTLHDYEHELPTCGPAGASGGGGQAASSGSDDDNTGMILGLGLGLGLGLPALGVAACVGWRYSRGGGGLKAYVDKLDDKVVIGNPTSA